MEQQQPMTATSYGTSSSSSSSASSAAALAAAAPNYGDGKTPLIPTECSDDSSDNAEYDDNDNNNAASGENSKKKKTKKHGSRLDGYRSYAARVDGFARIVRNYAAANLLSPDILHKCKGVAVIRMVKASYIWGVRAGIGMVVHRLGDGTWSAPLFFSVVGVGYGAQAGVEYGEMVFVLKNDRDVGTFYHAANLTFGANASVTLTAIGRSLELAASASLGVFPAYSRTYGLAGGVSVEGLIIVPNFWEHKKFYGSTANAKGILEGRFRRHPSETQSLMDALREVFTAPQSPPPAGGAAAAVAASGNGIAIRSEGSAKAAEVSAASAASDVVPEGAAAIEVDDDTQILLKHQQYPLPAYEETSPEKVSLHGA